MVCGGGGLGSIVTGPHYLCPRTISIRGRAEQTEEGNDYCWSKEAPSESPRAGTVQLYRAWERGGTPERRPVCRPLALASAAIDAQPTAPARQAAHPRGAEAAAVTAMDGGAEERELGPEAEEYFDEDDLRVEDDAGE